ncbi:glycosyl hydrolase family 8 [Gayadomonas joobiniege]|uniref:glycosyl hydrolase family 8 n=1 Tax=Gayadomonas joobiniege TaxID=1234606 RepID=UPI000371D314|nr:glycosyl hydrolase family 8 [Gayadomonas joobiniege]
MRLIIALILITSLPVCAAQTSCQWPAWQNFKTNFISSQGRVHFLQQKQTEITANEQAQILFFALLANDQNTFEQAISWTEQHLAEGDLSTRLPAARWGLNNEGVYTILADQPVLTANLWLAYLLSQAGDLWHQRDYQVLSAVIAMRILREHLQQTETAAWVFLDKPNRQFTDEQQWQTLAQTYPIFIVQYFARLYPESYWPTAYDALLAARLEQSEPASSNHFSLFGNEQTPFAKQSRLLWQNAQNTFDFSFNQPSRLFKGLAQCKD